MKSNNNHKMIIINTSKRWQLPIVGRDVSASMSLKELFLDPMPNEVLLLAGISGSPSEAKCAKFSLSLLRLLLGLFEPLDRGVLGVFLPPCEPGVMLVSS